MTAWNIHILTSEPLLTDALRENKFRRVQCSWSPQGATPPLGILIPVAVTKKKGHILTAHATEENEGETRLRIPNEQDAQGCQGKLRV